MQGVCFTSLLPLYGFLSFFPLLRTYTHKMANQQKIVTYNVHCGWTFSYTLFANYISLSREFFFLSLTYLWEFSCFSYLFLTLVELFFPSLLIIIIYLFLPCKDFNWYTVVYKSDFQNINIRCNASMNP